MMAHNGGPMSRALFHAANVYVKTYNNLNYDMATNGENHVLNRLSGHDIKVVFDVGANKGEYTAACLSRFPNATIHAFEIVPATFEKLAAGATSPRIKLNSFGLANSSGRLSINYNPHDDGSSSLVEGSSIHPGTWQKVEVDVVTGDDYCADQKVDSIDLLKIDVEGAENLVLEGFSKSFGSGRISSVQFEFGMVNIYSKFLLKDFWEFFRKHGFALGPIMPKGVDFKEYDSRHETFQGPPNFLAVHESKPKLIDAVKRKK